MSCSENLELQRPEEAKGSELMERGLSRGSYNLYSLKKKGGRSKIQGNRVLRTQKKKYGKNLAEK